MKLPKTVTMRGLPQADGRRLHPEQEYTFWFGYPAHLPGNSKIILRIPEQPHRDANGRPRYPEQAQWIDNVIQQERLNITAVWSSHWRFENEAALHHFLRLLNT
ncbi:hypothetical protein [Candidatus Leptofilum sp.]|uniref:hypothetical protein n=1 Tax=Candidatus Leptofilum sp. TaxID=3241576 RepID=UPI003B5AFA3B